MYADTKPTNNKILTISVAAYNVESTIERTLDSLVKDVPEEVLDVLEVIVENDGSKDGTLNIVKKYEESYPGTVRVIDKENGGWGSTVNASLKAANGRYFRLLDGDDAFATENLRDFLRFLKDSEADLILTPFIKRYPDKDVVESHHPEVGREVCTFTDLNSEADIYMHGISVRTDRMRSISFEITENCFYTDNEYVFKAIVAADTIRRYDKNIYIYHLGVTGQSVGAEGLKKHHSDTVKVLSKMYRIYKEFLDTSGTEGDDGSVSGKADTEYTNSGKFSSKNDDSDNIGAGKVGTEYAGIGNANIISARNAKLRFLQKGLAFIADLVFVAYLVTGTPEAKAELKAFDGELRYKYIEIDRLIVSNKKIRILRASVFLLYNVMSNLVRRRYA